MAKYRKIPVIIDAFRMGIDSRPDWFQDKVTSNDIHTFNVDENCVDTDDTDPFEMKATYCKIKTLEGVMVGDYGDYIIKGVKGEIYPCKPDIFKLTYEKVD